MILVMQFRIVDPFAKQLIVFIETIIQIVISFAVPDCGDLQSAFSHGMEGKGIMLRLHTGN